ncbi:MAG: sirohydrochlorin cobaltochelatase [Candidatus Methanomethylophilaceae archaeon]|nr:sirohydrochlorin cobaltochelatase [Candidatus Methanomethylophilaceae archaeon]
MDEVSRAYLLVSYGTASEAVEGAIAERHEGSRVFRAFTSRIEAKKAKVEHISTVFSKMAEEGVTHLTVQTLDVINGPEYEIVADEVRRNLDLFAEVRLGTPLLTSERDYRSACSAVAKDIVPDVLEHVGEGTAIVLVGRGTDHYANASYCQLQEMLNLSDDAMFAVTTVEGFPSFADTCKKLRRMGATSASVVPFIVDISEEDSEEIVGDEEVSLRMTLKSEGFKVVCFTKGLGARPTFQRLYADHADAAAVLKRER